MARKTNETSVLYQLRERPDGSYDVVETRTTVLLKGASYGLGADAVADLNGGSDKYGLLARLKSH